MLMPIRQRNTSSRSSSSSSSSSGSSSSIILLSYDSSHAPGVLQARLGATAAVFIFEDGHTTDHIPDSRPQGGQAASAFSSKDNTTALRTSVILSCSSTSCLRFDTVRDDITIDGTTGHMSRPSSTYFQVNTMTLLSVTVNAQAAPGTHSLLCSGAMHFSVNCARVSRGGADGFAA